jgi:PP-loop superfamily ATP-utilizing enzyme
MVDAVQLGAGEEEGMKENMKALSLEVEEIESRERAGGCSTSSSTSRLCTCPCFNTTSRLAAAEK